MFPPRPPKSKRRKVHKDKVDNRLAIGLLFFYVLATVFLLAANSRRQALPNQLVGGLSAVSIDREENGVSIKDAPSTLVKFISLDDFKSYFDGGRRAFWAGIFEEQVAAPVVAGQTTDVKKTAPKIAAAGDKKNAAADIALAPEETRQYLALGQIRAGQADILRNFAGKLYFSPENQFFVPPGEKKPVGETRIFDISRPAEAVQVGAIPRDGEFLLGQNSLAAFLNNTLAVYGINDVATTTELWRGRLGQDSEIVDRQMIGQKLYLAVATAIDRVNPCPIKPLVIGEKTLVIDCGAIHHSSQTMAVDSILTIIAINAKTGAVEQDISLAIKQDDSAVLIGKNAIYITWGRDHDQAIFLADFLNQKCKGLLPNYLLKKAAAAANCEVSAAAKEFELRSLLSEWFDAQNKDEQERVRDEVSRRLADYLVQNYRDADRGEIVKIDFDSFDFSGPALVFGNVPDAGFIDEDDSGFRAITISNTGIRQKMNWFFTGKIEPDSPQAEIVNAYVFDGQMKPVSAAENMDLPAGICGARFADGGAYAATCRPRDGFYFIDFAAGAARLAGTENISEPAYFHPLGNGRFLTAAKDGRKIKLKVFDALVPGKTEIVAEYSLNDYWADFSAGWRAFARDDAGKMFFLPAAKGGWLFSYAENQLLMKKNIAGINAARAFFDKGNLYLAGDDGVEIFSAGDFSKLKTIKF